MRKSDKDLWNPGHVDHSDPTKKVPTGYQVPDQSKSGKKTGKK